VAVPPRRILITGAAGFVGRHLTASLVAAYPDTALFTPAVDVRDAKAVADAVRQAAPEACFHLAAVSSIRAAQEDEDEAWEVNLHGTLRVARAILRHAPGCQMLFTSTADAYGGSFRGGTPVDEDTPLAPMSVYSATKAAADLAIGSMAGQGLRCVRIRPFNHTGPGQTAQFVVPTFARQIARIEAGLQPPLIQVGNVDTWRDFLDVRDVCAGYLACIAMGDRLASGSILNLASGTARRIGDILSDLQALAGITLEVRADPARVRDRDVPMACGSSRRARELLGWAPITPWAQTLQNVLDDWRVRIRSETKES
jgi:GDP-4-dehydro-6-deoxy-D-mannose reductase